MILDPKFNIWEHSAQVRELYTARARGAAEEMTCAAQAAEILAPFFRRHPGATLLDAGCGSGYYYHSFASRGLAVDYHGIDYSPSLIEIGRREMLPRVGLDAQRLRVGAIENLDGEYDVVLCFNTLPWLPDYRQALERMLLSTRHVLLLRTALGEGDEYRWEEDGYLEEGYNHLKAYWNIYSRAGVEAFMESYGFCVTRIADRRTGDGVEGVVGKPFPWRILHAERREARGG